MGVTISFGPVHDAIEKSLQDACDRAAAKGYEDGYNAGFMAAVARLNDAVQGMSPTLAAASPLPVIDAMEADARTVPPTSTRAPRGVLDDLLDGVLTDFPGLETKEVEAQISEADPRIAIKSVYNRLRHWEKTGKRFRRQGTKWYLIKDIPAPWADNSSPSSREGEAGVVAPASSTSLVKGDRPDGHEGSVEHENSVS